MNIQRKNSAHHFRMQSECEQTLGVTDPVLMDSYTLLSVSAKQFDELVLDRNELVLQETSIPTYQSFGI